MKAICHFFFFVLLTLNYVAQGAAPSTAPVGLKILNFTIDGLARTALLYVPPKRTDALRPVVFAFHGHGGNSNFAERQFQFDKLWPEAISIYPQGVDTPGLLTDPDGKKTGWQNAEGTLGDRDMHFVDAMVAQLKQDYSADPKRIYCVGHSNGALFTFLLWKTRPNVFAAFASCSGAAAFASELTPKPAMILSGRNDPIVKFDWQQRTMDAVRKVNGCDATGVAWENVATLYPSPGDTPLVTYIYPGGHAMDRAEPGLIVKFFQEYPEPTTRP